MLCMCTFGIYLRHFGLNVCHFILGYWVGVMLSHLQNSKANMKKNHDKICNRNFSRKKKIMNLFPHIVHFKLCQSISTNHLS